MASVSDIVTVFQCSCGSYIPEAAKLNSHRDVCSKLQKEFTAFSSKLTFDELRAAGGRIVDFYLPQVVLNHAPNSTSGSEAKSSCIINKNGCGHDNQQDLTGTTTPTTADVLPVDVTLRPIRSSSRTTRRNVHLRSYVDEHISEWERGSSSDGEEFELERNLNKKSRKRKNSSRGLKTSSGSAATAAVGKRIKSKSGDVADQYYVYKCDACPAKFRTEKNFEWHTVNIHGDGSKNKEIITCALCKRMFNRRLVYLSHLKNHENAEALEDAFDLWNTWPEKSRKGSSAAKMILKFNCKYCLIPHTSQHSFLTHMKVEHSQLGRFDKFLCPYCKISEFGSMKHFILHIRTVHPDEYYGKTITWSTSGANPLKQEGRPKGRCDICMKMFDVFYLRAHKEKLHSNKKKLGSKGQDSSADDDSMYTCAVPNCYARLKNRSLLKSHFILHLENNPFACPIPGCTVKCDAQCHLNRHMKLHTSPPLQCKKCGVYYSRKDKLNNHVCNYDQSKLVYDEHGYMRSINSKARLQRINLDEVGTITGNDNVVSGEVNNCKTEISTTEKNHSAGIKQVNAKRKYNKRTDINSIIISDPVFIKVCKDNPGFKELIIGSGSSTTKIKSRSMTKIKSSVKKRHRSKTTARKRRSVKKATKEKDKNCNGEASLNSNVACPVVKIEIESELIINDTDSFEHMESNAFESENCVKVEPMCNYDK